MNQINPKTVAISPARRAAGRLLPAPNLSRATLRSGHQGVLKGQVFRKIAEMPRLVTEGWQHCARENRHPEYDLGYLEAVTENGGLGRDFSPRYFCVTDHAGHLRAAIPGVQTSRFIYDTFWSPEMQRRIDPWRDTWIGHRVRSLLVGNLVGNYSAPLTVVGDSVFRTAALETLERTIVGTRWREGLDFILWKDIHDGLCPEIGPILQRRGYAQTPAMPMTRIDMTDLNTLEDFVANAVRSGGHQSQLVKRMVEGGLFDPSIAAMLDRQELEKRVPSAEEIKAHERSQVLKELKRRGEAENLPKKKKELNAALDQFATEWKAAGFTFEPMPSPAATEGAKYARRVEETSKRTVVKIWLRREGRTQDVEALKSMSEGEIKRFFEVEWERLVRDRGVTTPRYVTLPIDQVDQWIDQIHPLYMERYNAADTKLEKLDPEWFRRFGRLGTDAVLNLILMGDEVIAFDVATLYNGTYNPIRGGAKHEASIPLNLYFTLIMYDFLVARGRVAPDVVRPLASQFYVGPTTYREKREMGAVVEPLSFYGRFLAPRPLFFLDALFNRIGGNLMRKSVKPIDLGPSPSAS